MDIWVVFCLFLVFINRAQWTWNADVSLINWFCFHIVFPLASCRGTARSNCSSVFIFLSPFSFFPIGSHFVAQDSLNSLHRPSRPQTHDPPASILSAKITFVHSMLSFLRNCPIISKRTCIHIHFYQPCGQGLFFCPRPLQYLLSFIFLMSYSYRGEVAFCIFLKVIQKCRMCVCPCVSVQVRLSPCSDFSFY